MTGSNGKHKAPVVGRRAPVLVTGGAGFIGCNIADRLARAGRDVLIYDALVRPGVEANLAWLKARHGARISSVAADVRDEASLEAAAREASAVFHMAAQVAVTTSLADPMEDYEINVGGTVRLLDALRRAGKRTPLIFASTNKVYGDLADLEMVLEAGAYVPADARVRAHGVSEARALDFHTPYGCSKGAADQYVLDYARTFDLPTAVLRMSCIYGPRQMGTEDQGWVAHFMIRAMAGEPVSIYGDGRQVRDILHVSDAVDAYIAALGRIEQIKGQAYNLGGGPSNAVSLLQLLDYISEITGERVELEFSGWREGDQRYFVADTRKARRELGLGAPTDWRTGVADLARWLAETRRLRRPLVAAVPPALAAAR